MRKNPYLFTAEEYNFLHQIFMKQQDDTKVSERIKRKKGVGLDKTEIQLVKRRYSTWRNEQTDNLLLL